MYNARLNLVDVRAPLEPSARVTHEHARKRGRHGTRVDPQVPRPVEATHDALTCDRRELRDLRLR